MNTRKSVHICENYRHNSQMRKINKTDQPWRIGDRGNLNVGTIAIIASNSSNSKWKPGILDSV